MRWVNHSSYKGIDRRERESMRLFERRTEDHTSGAPSLATALRQLGFGAAFLDTPANTARFADHAQSVACLAESRGHAALAALLNEIATQVLGGPPGAALSQAVQAKLWKARTLFDEVGGL